LPGAVEDGLNACAPNPVLATQPVIGTGLDNQHGDAVAANNHSTRLSARRALPAHARVDDPGRRAAESSFA
jgi:hypothetical protein